MRKPVHHPGIRERRGRVELRYRDASGVQHSRFFDSLTEALDFQATVRVKRRTGELIDPARARVSLERFYAGWRARAEELGKPSERTLINYDEKMHRYVLPSLGKVPLAAISRADVEEVVASAPTPWVASDVLKVLRMILNRAVAEERIGRNPASRVAAPQLPRAEPWVLTPEEVERCADAVGERWRALVLTAAYSSLRWSELVALRVSRVDLLRRRIRVEEKITEHGHLIPGEPKTWQSRRSVTIPKEVAEEIAAHLHRHPQGGDGYVFAGEEGGPLRRSHFGRLVWRPATKAAGIGGFKFANLRHTGASLAIAAGAHSMQVAARLGHTSTRMIERHYVSLFEGLDAEVGEQLGRMRRRAVKESRRLRPGADVDQMWTKVDPDGPQGVQLHAQKGP
jgi:integrase